MGFALAWDHIEVETEGDNEQRTQKDPTDGSYKDYESSRQGFRVIVSVSNSCHGDEDAPEAIFIALKASDKSRVIKKQHSLRNLQSVSKDHEQPSKVNGNCKEWSLVEDAFDHIE